MDLKFSAVSYVPALGYSTYFVATVLATVVLAVLIMRFVYRRQDVQKVISLDMPPLDEQQRRIAAFRSLPFRGNSVASSNAQLPNRTGLDVVESRGGYRITLQSKAGAEGVEYIDLTTGDLHSFSTNPVVVDKAKQAVMAYGVGSCGPRGFYGTIKPHSDAEKDLAVFLHAEDAAIYSFSFATISTLISCYAGRGDYLIVDDAVRLAVYDGCAVSRANILKYRHNNMAHLEELLREVQEKETKEKKLSRRFVVTEGIFENLGDICKLPKILELCKTYKFRIILDDSWGFGCMGPTGRGTHEHFDIPLSQIDVYVGSLSNAVGCVGGFSVGDRAMVDYQRLAASAYVFSASLAPYITTGVSAVLSLLDEDHSHVEQLRHNTKLLREAVRAASLNAEKIFMIECEGDVSPVVVLRPTDAYVRTHPKQVEMQLEEVVQIAKKSNILITRHLYSSDEKCNNFPALRVLVKGKMTREDLMKSVEVLTRAVKDIFP
ncbi:putative Aminotransferase class I and II [Trypanosoma vivax]|nr:serine-palmitoyl-CoA transferase [Trypanosoma vivax]KAH8614003.1 putative Aminotransferase class I and II [Trypanosoma vivax]